MIEHTNEISHENTQKTCFLHKNNLKALKNMGDTNHFQKQTKIIKIFLVWSTYGWAHTSYLNMYNHTNEISINWIKVLCVMGEYQMWNSP